MIYIHLIPGCHKKIIENFKLIGGKFSKYVVDDYSDGIVISQHGFMSTPIYYNKELDFYIDEKDEDFGITSHDN